MRKGIAVAGNLILDTIKYVDQYPPRSTLATIRRMTQSPGGLVCNCTLGLAKLDPTLPLQPIGVVGADKAGDYIVNRLTAHPSVDASGIVRRGETSFTDVVTEEGGARTFLHYRGANAFLGPEHFDFQVIRTRILHIGYLLLLDRLDAPDPEFPTALCRVLRRAREAGIATSIDVVSEDGVRFQQLVPPALEYTDYCIINELEASRTTGIPLRGPDDAPWTENLEPVCRRLLEMGVRRWVVVHMPELSCGMEREGPYVQEPSWRIPPGFIKSSVGAGDAFASGILYAAYHNWTLARAIHVAGAVAAYSLSGSGACDAILPLPRLLEEMERIQKPKDSQKGGSR